MDELVTVALVGTAQRSKAEVAAGAPIDELFTGGDAAGGERRLLLQAGARAVYRAAGVVPHQGIAASEPAPPEDHPACSPGAAELIRGFLSGTHPELLPEALERLHLARLRLPFDMLPLALSTHHYHLALAHVIGARGRWLSRFNPAWAWVRGLDIESSRSVPEDAETVWQEGAPAERAAILRQMRAADPAHGRERLVDVWKREKAEMRAQLLSVLRVGLSLADEPFLEAALDDRAGAVREHAASLLTRLPDSALSRRMIERGDGVLTFTRGDLQASDSPASDAPVQRSRRCWVACSGGFLAVYDPAAPDASALRDGLVESASGQSAQDHRIEQFLSRVPLSHWSERFGVKAEDLVASTMSMKTNWRLPLLTGWTSAFLLHGGGEWVLPLWRAWHESLGDNAVRKKFSQDRFCQQLLPHLPQTELERVALEMMEADTGELPVTLNDVLSALPRPWQTDFAASYIHGLREFVSGLTPTSFLFVPWGATLETAALGLPAASFSDALEPFTLPESSTWHLREFVRKLESFIEAIGLRRRMMEEIPL